MNLGLENKEALIFGSSGGIGKSIAKSLKDEGANVCLCSRTEEKLKATKSEIGADDYIVGDLSIAGEGKRIAEEFIKRRSKIDALVINTGGPPKADFEEVSDEVWREGIQNLWMSTVEILNVMLPIMKKQKFGRVILITSVSGKEPMKSLTISNGLRAGLHGLMKSISHEVAIDGITLNCILPGFTDTERLQQLNLSDDVVKQLVPAGRLGEPCEIADLTAFLCSTRAGYITGQNISVDGGYLKAH
jgi:3-oxoacyl-[acyl-carrier protein] reductase